MKADKPRSELVASVPHSFQFGGMRPTREELIFRALCALDELGDHAGQPIPKSFMLRFTLAWLYSESDGTRWVFDAFWQEVTRPPMTGVSEHLDRERRFNAVHTGISGICRTLGFHNSVELSSRILIARRLLPPSSRVDEPTPAGLLDAGDGGS